MSFVLARPCVARRPPPQAHFQLRRPIERLDQRQRQSGRAAPAPAAAAAAPGQKPPLRAVPLPADYKQRVTQQFEARAPRYDSNNSFHPPLAAGVVQLAALQRGQHVLDVATGTGLVALLAAQEVGPTGSVLGVDLSPAMVAQAEEKAQAGGLSNTRFEVVDADACTFAPASFDAILCSSALPFFTDIPATLASWHSWLRPGGRVAFNVPKGVGSQSFSVFAEAAAQHGLLLRDPSSLFAEESAVRQMLTAAGYSAVDLSVSQEFNRRAGQTPQQWAAASWQQCIAFPLADLPAQLAPEQLQRMKDWYLVAAEELAGRYATAQGIEEPYDMLWVVAHK